jgi:hypothetical protein
MNISPAPGLISMGRLIYGGGGLKYGWHLMLVITFIVPVKYRVYKKS